MNLRVDVTRLADVAEMCGTGAASWQQMLRGVTVQEEVAVRKQVALRLAADDAALQRGEE